MLVGFTVSGAALPMLNVGERGIITRFTQANTSTIDQLQALGLNRGTGITLEQRHPKFIVKTEQGRLALTPQMARAIYVRLHSDSWAQVQTS